MYNDYHRHHYHSQPCLHCHPQSYIRMVQHLIERCLLLQMDRDQCIKALAEHAKIKPLITLTVWRELLKENRNFFQAYFHGVSPTPLINKHVQQSPRITRRRYWR
ncbi:uncharacterized protein LOC110709003 [Chenopodium quinoa]|uniref:uncharacterized protein LOC110709003 n=1 Tax=Chenopodium quinoa TaxID=63459 RepID=UPI000B76C1E1|nr:uncharacterized protein LOC110709003 [Chenopodium quinoa]